MVLFWAVTMLFSCEELRSLTIHCSECTSNRPLEASIKIRLDSGFGSVLISVYEGSLEDNILYNSFTTLADETTSKVPLNKKYTLTATYQTQDGKTYISVDTSTPHSKYEDELCDYPCYYVYNNTVNLKLKYTP